MVKTSYRSLALARLLSARDRARAWFVVDELFGVDSDDTAPAAAVGAAVRRCRPLANQIDSPLAPSLNCGDCSGRELAFSLLVFWYGSVGAPESANSRICICSEFAAAEDRFFFIFL